jgi:peptidoglycan-associated lipoprotein
MGHALSRSLLLPVLVLAGLGLTLSCKSTPPAEPPTTTPPQFEPAQPAEKVDETQGFKEAEPAAEPIQETASSLAAKLNAQGVLTPIHFDFDKYDLRPDAIRTLNDNATAIKKYTQFKVRIEGNCDERGTVEYNLALGEKRARAARDYLVSVGVPAASLRIISYGKERPNDPGHNETAWAANRRDEFVFLAQ